MQQKCFSYLISPYNSKKITKIKVVIKNIYAKSVTHVINAVI